MAAKRLAQKGGSRPFIKDLVPEVTSPDTMEAKMEYFLVSGHGMTNPELFMVVPENTFVMFLGQSAFLREIWDRPEQLSRLVSARGYIPDVKVIKRNDDAMMKRWSSAQEQRKADLYKSFITGESEEFKFYKGATIYCPGDLLPDTRIDFSSGSQNVWNKGVYSLPVLNDEFANFTEWTNPVFTLVELIQTGVAEPSFIESRLKPGKRDEFLGFYRETYESWLQRYPLLTPLSEFFDRPEELNRIFDEMFYKERRGNLAVKAGIPIGGDLLSEMLGKFPSEKPYRLFIITSCRAPMNVEGRTEANFGVRFQGLPPTNFPLDLTAVAQRRFMRRASISSKCAIDQGKPAMNLNALRAAFLEFVKTPEIGKVMGTFGHGPMSAIITYLQVHFFTGPHLEFPAYIPLQIVAILLAYAYMNELPEVPAFRALIEEIRDTFGEFTRLLRREASFSTKGLSVEQILLKYADLDIVVSPILTNEVAIQRSIRGEKEMYKPRYAKEVVAFQKEMDAVLKKGQDGFKVIKKGIEEVVESGNDLLKTLAAVEIPQLKIHIEDLEVKFKEGFLFLRDTFETEQEQVFFNYVFLKEADKSYRMEDSMNLIDAFKSWPKLVKPMRALLRSVETKMSGGGVRHKRRNLTRRRSGR